MTVESRSERIAAIGAVAAARKQVSKALQHYSGMREVEKEDLTAALCALNELMVKMVPLPGEGRGRK